KNLFGESLEVAPADEHKRLGAFLAAWVDFEREIAKLSRQHIDKVTTLRGDPRPPIMVVRELIQAGVFAAEDATAIEELRLLRNEVVHGMADYKTAITDKAIKQLREITNKYRV